MTIRKVLLVDDEPDIRKLGKLSLQAIGKWEVIVCSNGVEALEAAIREKPDAILMDVMMPQLDGPSTLTALRKNESTCDIPVIFMTATSDLTEMARLVAMGALGVIQKPFAPLTLPGKLTAMVERNARESAPGVPRADGE